MQACKRGASPAPPVFLRRITRYLPHMATHPAQARVQPDAYPPPAPRLADCLSDKLAELSRGGLTALWIEASQADLTTLVIEDDKAIVLDPDPGVDRAWYAGVEIRRGTRELTWVFVKGEVAADPEEISAHIVSLPDLPDAATTEP